MNIVQKFLKETYVVRKTGSFEFLKGRKRINCKDGYSVSVQASEMHYCSPRENLSSGMYSKVELGYPSEFDEELNFFAEEKGSIETVFGYVPVEFVEKLINKHGGIV